MLPRTRLNRYRPLPTQLAALELAVLAALLAVPARTGSAQDSRPASPESRPSSKEDAAVSDTTPEAPKTFDRSRSDAKAIEIADQLMGALGGKEAWDKAHFLKFTFTVLKGDTLRASRTHYWDKWTGWHRFETKKKTGEEVVIVHNLETHEAMARMGDQETKGEGAAKFEQNAYGAWVNDTYWLLMPYKLEDPGVILKYDGEVKDGDTVYDKVLVTFDGVGLTPKDKYWAYVNRATHMMDRWGFILNGESEPETVCDWKNWKNYGSIMLSDEKPIRGTDQRIVFVGLEVSDSLPGPVFASTAPLSK